MNLLQFAALLREPHVMTFAYQSKVGGEWLLPFLQGLDLARGEGLEVCLLSFQPGPLGADLPEGRLLLGPPPWALAAGHLFENVTVRVLQLEPLSS